MEDRAFILASETGKKLGEVTVALIAIVHVLKGQPGFDAAAFDTAIQSRLASLDKENLTHVILTAVLDAENRPKG